MTVTVSVTVTQVREEVARARWGAGSSAGRPGGAVLLHADLGSAAGGAPGSRRAGERDRGVGPGTAAAAAGVHVHHRLRTGGAGRAAHQRRGDPARHRRKRVRPGRGQHLRAVRAARMAYRNAREANLYPADARWILPEDPYSMGMRALVAYHLAEGGYGQAQEVIAARTGATVGRAQLAQLAGDLAGWADEFYDQRAFAADTGLPDSDVIMMQADGKGIAMRPGHRASAGKETDSAHPGIKKMAEIVAVADFTPAVREPEDIAAPQARRKERPGPHARGKWVAASITGTIDSMIGVAFNEADRRDPEQVRQRVFLVTGTSSSCPPSPPTRKNAA